MIARRMVLLALLCPTLAAAEPARLTIFDRGTAPSRIAEHVERVCTSNADVLLVWPRDVDRALQLAVLEPLDEPDARGRRATDACHVRVGRHATSEAGWMVVDWTEGPEASPITGAWEPSAATHDGFPASLSDGTEQACRDTGAALLIGVPAKVRRAALHRSSCRRVFAIDVTGGEELPLFSLGVAPQWVESVRPKPPMTVASAPFDIPATPIRLTRARVATWDRTGMSAAVRPIAAGRGDRTAIVTVSAHWCKVCHSEEQLAIGRRLRGLAKKADIDFARVVVGDRNRNLKALQHLDRRDRRDHFATGVQFFARSVQYRAGGRLYPGLIEQNSEIDDTLPLYLIVRNGRVLAYRQRALSSPEVGHLLLAAELVRDEGESELAALRADILNPKVVVDGAETTEPTVVDTRTADAVKPAVPALDAAPVTTKQHWLRGTGWGLVTLAVVGATATAWAYGQNPRPQWTEGAFIASFISLGASATLLGLGYQ